jgi:hypothetical protein
MIPFRVESHASVHVELSVWEERCLSLECHRAIGLRLDPLGMFVGSIDKKPVAGEGNES